MKRNRKVKYAVLVICIVVAAAAAAFVGQKLYVKTRNLYDYVADKVDIIERTADRLERELIEAADHAFLPQQPWTFDYSWMEKTPPYIAHAMGGIDGNVCTNSLEAFEHNYALGHRVFEVDFWLTEGDYQAVAFHDEKDWRRMAGVSRAEPLTYDLFMSHPTMGAYTPLDYRDVIDLMAKYPDMYIVTDSKHTNFAHVHLAFSQLVDYANSVDPAILERVIPQIYHEEMLDWIMDIHPFRSVIYTLYQTSWTPDRVYEFCLKSGVRFITMNKDIVAQSTTDLWSKLGVTIAAHTCNAQEQAEALFDGGVDMIYTDFLLPEK